jgi:uncharacterized protein (AIM24 family)
VPTYHLINEKLLEVTLSNDDIFSKKGAMIAYTGHVKFARAFITGGGIQEFAMRAVTNEGFQMMKAEGTGSVCYAHLGYYIMIITLQGEMLYVESESVLVFDRRLRSGTSFLGNQGAVQGLLRGAVTGQGLFTTTLEGRGDVAIISDGNAIGLDVTAQKPIFVDPNAYIGHKGQLTSQIVTDMNWKTFLGQASGESYQLKFTGTGTVYIQPSER